MFSEIIDVQLVHDDFETKFEPLIMEGEVVERVVPVLMALDID